MRKCQLMLTKDGMFPFRILKSILILKLITITIKGMLSKKKMIQF